MSAAIHHLIDDMIEVLRAERRAVATLEVDTLNRLTEQKVEQLARLEALMAEVAGDDPDAAELRERVARVSIEAETNALLIRDALDVVRVLLGSSAEGGVYDARGAVKARERRGAVRSI